MVVMLRAISKYYFDICDRLSIYHHCIWHDNGNSTTITMIKLRSYLHSRTTPHTSPLRAIYEVSFVSYNMKKMTAIYRERVLSWSRNLLRNFLGVRLEHVVYRFNNFGINKFRIGRFIHMPCILQNVIEVFTSMFSLNENIRSLIAWPFSDTTNL